METLILIAFIWLLGVAFFMGAADYHDFAKKTDQKKISGVCMLLAALVAWPWFLGAMWCAFHIDNN